MNHSLLFSSIICVQLTCSTLIPKCFHMDLFHCAPSVTIASTNTPLFSNRTIASIMILCRIDPLAAPRLRKHATDCSHDPCRGWKSNTRAWSPNSFSFSAGVCLPRLVKPEMWTKKLYTISYLKYAAELRSSNTLPVIS